MYHNCARSLSVALIGIGLCGCAFVDHFGSRVYDSNLNSQDAMNQEMLLNIIRASEYQPLNFVAVAQVTGNQMESLSNGLPTFTFGPAQTNAQHQFVFANNSLSSSVQGAFQSNPLVSSAFSDGMLSPMTPRMLALLVGNRPREPVYYAVVDSIRLKIGGVTVSYRNDPRDDKDVTGNFSENCSTIVRENALKRAFFLDGSVCSFSKFQIFLKEFLAAGLTADLVPCDPNAKKPILGCTKPSSQGSSSSNAESVGRLCWDQALALPSYKKAVETTLRPLCGSAPSTGTASLVLSIQTLGAVTLDAIVLRSPVGVFNYFGMLLRENLGDKITFYTGEARRLQQQGGPFLDIRRGGDGGICFTAALYEGQFYCVPEGAYTTAMVLDILEQLRNLRITPTDLNAAFAVRVID